MKRIFLVFFLIFCFVQLEAKKVASFPHLTNPKYLVVDSNQIIVSNYPYIYIYSLKDFTLKKKIGGKGEGPGEFYIPQGNRNLKDRGLVISVCPDYIAASSVGRVSFFKRNGEIYEISKLRQSNLNAKFLFTCDRLLGLMPKRKGRIWVSIFDLNFENSKKILECDYWFNLDSDEMYNVFDRASDTLLIAVQDNKIFIARGDSPTLMIDTFNTTTGSKLFTIRHKTDKVSIPKSYLERLRTYFQSKYRLKSDDPYLKELSLPKFFPAMRNFCAADQKIYVVTFKELNSQTNIMIFSTDGSFEGNTYLPVKERNPEHLAPFSISKNRFYQIVENEETENWELFVSPIN